MGVQVTVAPGGRPDGTQVGDAAGLGPALVHVKVPVTGEPAAGLGGKPVTAACMSACGTGVTVAVAISLPGLASAVADPAVPVILIGAPSAGAINDTLHVIVLPTASVATGGVGLHTVVAPGGRPVTAQVAVCAALGPLLKQVTTPVTVLPAGGLVGNPAMPACISARGVIAMGCVATLLAGLVSCVLVPATAEILSGPVPGAAKVAVHVITPAAPTGCGSGAGLGVQVCGVPAGKPVSAQLGAAAVLGPLFVHVPVTVTDSPAFAVAGAVTAATTSTCGTVLVAACAVLLDGAGSGLDDPAVPVTVSGAPFAGAV